MAKKSARGAVKVSRQKGTGSDSARTGADRGIGRTKKSTRTTKPAPPTSSLPPIPKGLEVVLQKNDWLVAVRERDPRIFGWIVKDGRWQGMDRNANAIVARVSLEIAAEIRRLVQWEKESWEKTHKAWLAKPCDHPAQPKKNKAKL